MKKTPIELVMFILTALVLFSCAGCTDEDPASPGGSPSPEDTTPPDAVTDLRVWSVTGSEVLLYWTAPGDDGVTGTASVYDVRYSTEPMTEGNWEDGIQATTEPDPSVSGTDEGAVIDTSVKADFHFALKTADEADNWSELSNVVMGSVEDPPFVVHQLTNEDDNFHPCLDDGHVVWVRAYTVEDHEIYIADLNSAYPTPTRLTDNGGEKGHPNNHGTERIVWEGRNGAIQDWEIWIYDHYAIPRFRQFEENEVDDLYPDLDTAGSFVWQQESGAFEEIRYFIESAHSQTVISNDCCPSDSWSNEIPSADDGLVVWRSYDQIGSEGFRVSLWDGVLTDLTATLEGNMIFRPSLQAGGIAYQYGANPTMIRYWDGMTVKEVGEGFDPSLYDGTVAYEEWDGHDWEIRYWDGAKVHEITDNEINDTGATLYGSIIAWEGSASGAFGQIYYASVAK